MNTRRKFIQTLASSAITFPIGVDAASTMFNAYLLQPFAEQKVLRVAIMGLGSYGNRVAEAMQSCTRAKLAGLISGTPAKVKSWQSKNSIPDKNCYDYQTFDTIKDNPDIDAVYVITPNSLHHDHVIRAAKAA